MVRQLFHTERVGGSIPPVTTTIIDAYLALYYNRGMQIKHDSKNDYPGILDAFAKMIGENGINGCGKIHQICNLMTLEALEITTQAAFDRFNFQTGTKDDDTILTILEGILKDKRGKKNDRGI